MFTNQSSLVLVSILFTFSSIISIEAFHVNTQPNTSSRNTRLHAQSNNSSNDNERRKILSRGAGAALSILLGGTAPAEASYTAYTRREEDWQQRSEKGDIKISNARQLRAQLREIAPMNDEGSKIFCPNGASAAVSPLMENKCGDRQALPSVYGRADDAMGNSVPGFAVGSADGGGSSSALRAELNAQSYFRPNDDR